MSVATAAPQRISHWFAQLYPVASAGLTARPALARSRSADVCIVGAGYTGLWTAYELKRADPSKEIVVLEAEVAGYGASGRNGGAVIAQVNGSRDYWTKRGGRDGAIALERAVQESVDHIGEVVAREQIDCQFAKNGVLIVARNELEARHLRASISEDREWGFGEDDSSFLEADEVSSRVAVDGAVGARFSSHCASVHPGALVRGLADVVERLGVTIYEQTRVGSIRPGVAHVGPGLEVRADVVVRATEAYTESLSTHRRLLVPVHTSMLATEVIDDATWRQLGWSGREAVLAEHPFLHLQHTADHRITIGGDDNRIPYRYGSAVCPDGPAPEKVAAMYRAELIKLFPALAGVRIEHSWQGVFAAPRNWAPAVGLDPSTGLAWAGGYVGEGLAVSNLAARTLADLVLGRDTDRTRLPFVGPAARRWEPEPLRLIGSALIGRMRAAGDRSERRSGKPSRLVGFANRLAGFTGHLG